MGLDLSALEDDAPAGGAPLQIPLGDVSEDPNQPRTEFSQEAMADMTASVTARGIKTPVSVRPDPEKEGAWILNYGARRYRAAVAAKLDTIPAFVDENHTDYDQIVENLQRDSLKPMELALFIDKKLNGGAKKGEIAKQISVDGSVITQHLALIDPPDCIEAIYSAGKCTSPKTLYDLRGLHAKHPADVEQWCESTDEITRKSVSELAKRLKGQDKNAAGDAETKETNSETKSEGQGGEQESLDADQTGSGSAGTEQAPDDPNNSGEPGTDDTKESEAAETLPPNGGGDTEGKSASTETVAPSGDLSSWETAKKTADPDRLKKPLLLVVYDERSAAVLLSRKPSTDGLLWIKYEDNGEEIEIDAGACSINLLTEG